MRRRPWNAILLLVTLSAVVMGLGLMQAPAYADGADPPPIHRDTGDTTGAGTSIPDYPLGGEDGNLSAESESALLDVVLFTLKVII